MKMPSVILQFAYRAFFKNLGTILEGPLDKIENLDVIAASYNNGDSLEQILHAYVTATEGLSDDEALQKVDDMLATLEIEIPKALEKFQTHAASEVLAELLKDLAIPDFDDEAGNEVKVIDVINGIFEDLED